MGAAAASHRCGQRPHPPRLVPPVCPRWWGFGRRPAGGGGFGRWWGVWPLAAGRCPGAARTSVVIEAGIGFVPEAIFVSYFRGLHEQLGGGSLRQRGFGRRFARAGVGIRPPLRQGGGEGFGRRGEGGLRPPRPALGRCGRRLAWEPYGHHGEALAESTHGNPLIRKAFPAASTVIVCHSSSRGAAP